MHTMSDQVLFYIFNEFQLWSIILEVVMDSFITSSYM